MKKVLVIVTACLAAALLFSCTHSTSNNTPAPATTPATGTPSAGTPATTAPAATSPVKVTLSWDQPVDMDLEIWNSAATNLIHRAFPEQRNNWLAPNCGQDVTNGQQGKEFFIFKNCGTEDFSNGQYVISVYFAKRPDGSSIDGVFATVTIEAPGKPPVERRRKVMYAEGSDQWHVCRIDAATGAILEDIDQFIKINMQ